MPISAASRPIHMRVADLAVHVQNVDRVGLHAAFALPVASRYSPELIIVHAAFWRSSFKPAKSSRRIGSSTHSRGKPAFSILAEFVERFLAGPGLVGVDHHARLVADRLAQQREPMEVALQVGMADLDLERGVSELARAAEERDEFGVRHVIVEAAGVGAHFRRVARPAADRAAVPHAWRRDPTAPSAARRRTAATDCAGCRRAGA